MSCPDFVISERGRAAIGVGQGMPAGDYPIVAPSDDIAGLIADMHFAYDDLNLYSNLQPKKEPLRIKYLAGLGCLSGDIAVPNGLHAADIQIVAADDAVVFDSFADATVVYTKTTWSADYDIHEWRGEYAVCRLVTYKTWPKTDVNDTDATTARNYASKIAPTSSVINARAVYKMPKRLLSMRVNTAGTITSKAKGEIVFKNGYNTEISVSAAGTTNFRNNTRISVSGVAGSGLGRFFNCADTNTSPVITTINGVAPTSAGDFVMGGKDCLWSTHPVAITTTEDGTIGSLARDPSAGIKFGADCKACCSCEDYAATAEYMNQVAYRYQLIGQRAQEVYTQHETNVANWSNTSCGVGEVLRLVATAQECGAVDAAVTLCNTCDTCIPAASLTLDMYVPEPDDRLVPVDLSTDIFIRHGQNTNVHGNQLLHGIDCSYTKLSGAPLGTAINIGGNFESQFGLANVIDTAGQPVDDVGTSNTPTIPQIKPRSLLWPTFVPNVFTADTPTTEMMYDPGVIDAYCIDYAKPWNDNKDNPEWDWRNENYLYRPSFDKQAINIYLIRVEDNDPLPSTAAASGVESYLQAKYVPRDTQKNFVAWGAIGRTVISGNTVVEPSEHDRWWSPIGGVDYGTEDINGEREIRAYELINEGQIGAIISTPAAATALATRLNIGDPAAAADDVFIGILSGDFETDVTPSVGMSVVDKFGLFSSWSPVGSGVNGFWPAPVYAVYSETGDTFKVVWIRIKRPQAPNTTFPEINIDFAGNGGTTTREKTIDAQIFNTLRFYNMNVFSEHIKLSAPGGAVAPWPATQNFNRLATATNTTSISDAIYSKPERYFKARTPRRITIATPAVNPGSTIQVDFRVTLRELDFLAYASEYTTASWSTCDDAAAELKFCDSSPLSVGGTPLYDGAERMVFVRGMWSPPAGKDGYFYTHVPAKFGVTISHPDGTAVCPPPLGMPLCDNNIVPEYWRLLRWTKTHDEVVIGPPESEDSYLGQYACSSDGKFSGVVTITQLSEGDDDNPPTYRVKVCAFTYADNGKKLTKRKITPRGPYTIELVLTGKKPSGSLADLTKQHILDKACEGDPTAKKAFIAEVVNLKCDTNGRTPDC